MTIRFDDAWANARTLARSHAARSRHDVVVVRDLVGRVGFVVDCEDPAELSGLADALADATGRFASRSGVTPRQALFAPEMIFESQDRFVEVHASAETGEVSVIERGVVGAEWLHPALNPAGRRVTLYGFKGGVGRSTASFMLAQHLANQDLCVLVVDLDLESPGVGTLLRPIPDLCAHGILDHFAEAAVGNAEDLDLVVRSDLIPQIGIGEIWLAPAHGYPRAGYEHLAKLNRAYADIRDGERQRTFADRLTDAVGAAEAQVTSRSRPPDVVLLDSRAGVHDIAAVAITQLGGLNLLFATDSPQTWFGYQSMFEQWTSTVTPERLDKLRKRVKMVASMVPPSNASSYLARFRDRAQDVFATTLYDESAGYDLDAFNFAPDDYSAPHSPLPITFSSDLVGNSPDHNPRWFDNTLVAAAYTEFLTTATEMIQAEEH